jgi:hypothetical protein
MAFAIGLLKDAPECCESAAEYLRSWGKGENNV